jgi:hypothetical protein
MKTKRFLLLGLVFLCLSSCAFTDYATKLPEFNLADISADLNFNIPIGKRVGSNQHYRAPKDGAVIVDPQDWENLKTQLAESERKVSEIKKRAKDYSKEVKTVVEEKLKKATWKERLSNFFRKDKE